MVTGILDMATSDELQSLLGNLQTFLTTQEGKGTEELKTGVRKRRTRGDRVTDLLNLRNRGPEDFLRESLSGNAELAPGILDLANFISGNIANTTAGASEQGADLYSRLARSGAADAGVDIPSFTEALTGIGLQNFQTGQQAVNEGQALIDGSFFNTAVGKQSQENLLRSLAPGLSPAGLDATQSAFGGAASKGETDQITAFLRNAIEERNTGFGLRNQGVAAKDAAASRLGGVLTFGTQFGQGAAQFGGQFGQGVGNLASQLTANHLLTPSTIAQDTQHDAQSVQNFISMKAIQKQQDDAASAANKAGIGSAIGQIAGLALAPFTGGLSLAAAGAAGAAGGAAGGDTS